MHTHVCTYTHPHMHITCRHVCIGMYTRAVHTGTEISVCAHAHPTCAYHTHMCTGTHMHVYACACMYTHSTRMHGHTSSPHIDTKHTLTRAHRHTYTYIRVHKCVHTSRACSPYTDTCTQHTCTHTCTRVCDSVHTKRRLQAAHSNSHFQISHVPPSVF